MANPMLKGEWENLANTYVRLAEQSDDGWDTPYDPIQDMLDRTRHRPIRRFRSGRRVWTASFHGPRRLCSIVASY
jgi:hypothetical protein